MKNNLLLLLLLSAWGARAQTVTLAQESFETNGEGTRYTSNSFDLRTNANSVAGAFPYFTRALTNPLVNPLNTAYVSFGTNAYPVTIGNVTGSVFWAGEAVESTATTPASTDRAPGVVTLNAINASNYASLALTVALADARGPSSPTITQGGLNPQNEANDVIRLQYSTDGGATYTTLGQFLGNNSTGTGTGYMQRDIDLDGAITAADGAQAATNTLDISLRDFSFAIPGSPAALLVRVQFDQRGASEELAFDNIRVTGVLNTVAPPVLANIEGSALPYAEGQAATPITGSLTVTNAAGNLTGATVTISSGRVSAQDVLVFNNQNGITGLYNASTGVLSLTGTASAAAYQVALRSVAYQNNNSANATAGTRTIQFVVANGGTTSGVASRNVAVTSALNAATTLPYREDFTTDGEGTRYASNTFTNSGTGAAWLRTSANPYQTAATTQVPVTFSGISSSFYWYGNNTNSTANPARLGVLQTLPINTAGYVNLNFSLLLGASSGANASWQTADYFKVYYRTGGNSGTWVPILSFRGNSTVVAGQGNLQRDADPAATTTSPAPTGTTLTPALAPFSVALPSAVYGQTLELQLVLMADDIRAELAFDNLQLTGTQLVAPSVATTAAATIASTSATLGGSVTADGGAALTDRGVVYSSTNTTPTIADNKTTIGTAPFATGAYGQAITSLAPGTTYYVRAYATNSVGTSYGAVVSFATAAALATVTTAAPASITGISAQLGGSITATGGASITDRGVVYVLGTSTPTSSDTKVTIGALAGTGTFAQVVAGLRGNTTYTVRAYATNSAGTAYGATQTFVTPNNPPTANPDAITIAEDSGFATIDLLANDTSAPDVGELLTVSSYTQPVGGFVLVTGANYQATFVPNLNFNGVTTFTYTLSDGNGGTATALVTITVTSVNDAPVVTTTTGNTTFTPGAGAVALDNGLTVADVDNATLASATVSLTAGLQSGQDVLAFSNTSAATFGNIGSSTSSTGTLTLASAGATATVAQWQAALRAVTFNNTSASASTSPRTVSFVVNDGSLNSAAATKILAFAGSIASITAAGPLLTNASTVYYDVVFSNVVTGVTTSNFTVLASNLTGASVAAVMGAGTTYRIEVNTGTLSNPGLPGSVQLQFSSGTGIAPPVASAGLTGPAYTIDRTSPTATLSSSAVASGGSTTLTAVPFTLTFSEPVVNFTYAITVSGGAYRGGGSGSGTTYTFNIIPTSNGPVTVSIAANVAQDAAGNGNTASAPYVFTYTVPITSTTWRSGLGNNSNWFDPQNWTAGVPTANIDAFINLGSGRAPVISGGTAMVRNLYLGTFPLTLDNATLTIKGDFTNSSGFFTVVGANALLLFDGSATQAIRGDAMTVSNLTVGPAGLTLAADVSVRNVLTLQGDLTPVINKTLTLLSSASTGDALVVNDGGVVAGTATVQRAIDPSLNPGLGYRHYSSPVSNSTVADLATSRFAPVVNPAYNSAAAPNLVTPFPTVFGYDDRRLSLTNNLSSFDKGFFSPAALSDPLVVGRGYTVNISASEVVDFQGTLNSGDLPLTLTSTRPTYPDGGWQLLGNPYPAPLDYSRVAATDRQGLEGAIYVYSSTSQYAGRYRSYVNGMGNPVLPVGQGFFARVATGLSTATLTFRNSQRLTAQQGTTFQRPAETRPLVQLTLQNASGALADEATVYFEQGATSGFDLGFDAEKLSNPSGLNLSTSSQGGRQFSIDGQPELGATQRVVPLAVGVPAAGAYTFTASQLLNLTNVPVYLRDVQLGTLTDLRQQPSYQFIISNAAALNTARFELIFSPRQVLATVPAALAQQVALYPNPAKTQATIELPASLSRQPVAATLLDALGRVVRQQVLPAGLASHTLPLADLATGVYSLRLATEMGTLVKKLVVE